MAERTYNNSESKQKEGEAQDISLLQRPLHPTLSYFLEAKRAYENGTDEVRRFLVDECQIIYECYVCRNLFRSLVNFMSHKRQFCKLSARYFKSKFADRSSSVILQPTEQTQTTQTNNDQNSDNSTDAQPINTNKNINNVIDRLHRQKVNEQTGTVLQLESVPSSSNAVYQTVKDPSTNTESIKAEVVEVEELLNSETVFSADGKKISNNTAAVDTNKNATVKLDCNVCKTGFKTSKALSTHIEQVHLTKNSGYKCAHCAQKFSKFSILLQHMNREHDEIALNATLNKDNFVDVCLAREDKPTSTTEQNISSEEIPVKPKKRLIKYKKLRTPKSAFRRTPHKMNKTNTVEQESAVCATEIAAEEVVAVNQAPNRETVHEIDSINDYFDNLSNNNTDNVAQTLAVEIEALEINSSNDSTDTAIKAELISPVPKNDTDNEIEILNELITDDSEMATDTAAADIVADVVSIKMDIDIMSNDELNGDDNSHIEDRATDSVADTADIAHKSDTDVEKSDEAMYDQTKVINVKSKTTRRKSRCSLENKFVRCQCKLCHKEFTALSNLRRHISMYHYRANRFGCTLCNYSAFRRYDIVNHLGSMHNFTDDCEGGSLQYISVNEIKYTKDDVDNDIILLSADEQQTNDMDTSNDNKVRSCDKRAKRKLSVSARTDKLAPNDECKRKRRKMKKINSKLAVVDADSPSKTTTTKRPMRNRTKPENKDFVYDTPGSHKSNEQSSKKRRTASPADKAASTTKTKAEHKNITSDRIFCYDAQKLKGAAYRIAWEKTKLSLAKAGAPPILPTARPEIRPRLSPTIYSRSQSVVIIDNTELELRRKTLLDDSYVRNFAEASDHFKIKPCLETENTTVDVILNKMKSSMQHNALKPKKNLNEDQHEDLNTNVPMTIADTCNKETNNVKHSIVDTLLQKLEIARQQHTFNNNTPKNSPLKDFNPQFKSPPTPTKKKLNTELSTVDLLLQKINLAKQHNALKTNGCTGGTLNHDNVYISNEAVKSQSLDELSANHTLFQSVDVLSKNDKNVKFAVPNTISKSSRSKQATLLNDYNATVSSATLKSNSLDELNADNIILHKKDSIAQKNKNKSSAKDASKKNKYVEFTAPITASKSNRHTTETANNCNATTTATVKSLKSNSLDELTLLQKIDCVMQNDKHRSSTKESTKRKNMQYTEPATNNTPFLKSDRQNKIEKMMLKMDSLVPSNKKSKLNSDDSYTQFAKTAAPTRRVSSVDRTSTETMLSTNGERIFDSGIVLPKSNHTSSASKNRVTILERITDTKSKRHDGWLRTVLNE